MLHVHAADRLAPLAAGLAEVLAEPPDDPFAGEWVAVPAEGMRRWLSLELARHLGAGPQGGDGIAANITYGFPGALRTAVLAAGRGDGEDDPWSVERLVWPVLGLLAEAAQDPELHRFADGPGPVRVSRYGRARRLADLFDRYQVHRPSMVRSWTDGHDVDGVGRPLGPGQRWQPHLWRRLRAAVGEPSPAERLPDLHARLRAGDLDLDLPDRLVLFGLSVLPGGTGFAELAASVAAHRDLHLLLLDPSPATSALVRAHVQGGPPRPDRGTGRARMRQDDDTAALAAHPLLRSWARPPRELAAVLADEPEVPAPVLRAGPVPPPTTLLATVQADLRAGTAPAGHLRPEPDDRSVQVHAAHGAVRQVEVLRDAILHLLAADPTLEEDDIVVVCPSLDRFAPLIETGFGESAGSGPRHHAPAHPPALRYRVTDRSLRRANPVVDGVATVVGLAGGRFEGPAVLDLAAQPAVRERYQLTETDLGRLATWVADGQVRWGLDPEHRTGFGIPPTITTNTWRAALDRLLLGATVADGGSRFTLGGVVPLGIEGDDVDLAGRLADLIGRLARLADAVGEERTLADWLDLIGHTAARVVAPARDEAEQRDALDRALGELLDAAGPAAHEARLTWPDLRRVLEDALEGPPGRSDALRGGITVTSAGSLRWVPHRVVCLLGMDQQAFAPGAVDGDDLAAAAPLLGDRDPRGEGRQAVLEAILAAGDHLVVVRDGHDVRTNQPIPPAVVVAELLDAVWATLAPEARPEEPAGLELHHPRQAFDERNLRPGALGPLAGARPWTFDPSARAGAEARRTRAEAPPFLAEPLPAVAVEVVELADLHAVLAKPARFFLDRRLGLRLPRHEDALLSRLPVVVQALDEWKVADPLLRARLDGADLQQQLDVERASGTLPPGVLGDAKVRDIEAWIEQLAAAAEEHDVRPGPARPHPIDATLPDGRRVVGSVGLRLGGAHPGPARVGYSRRKPAHLLEAWLDLLALTATEPEVAWRSVAINREASPATSAVATVLEVPGADAHERRALALDGLEVAVDLLTRSLTEPLPLFPRLSRALYLGEPTRKTWTRTNADSPPLDRDDPHAEVVFGELDHDDLLDLEARPHDPPGAGRRAARYAAHLWSAVERTSHEPAEDGAR